MMKCCELQCELTSHNLVIYFVNNKCSVFQTKEDSLISVQFKSKQPWCYGVQ